MNISFVRIPEVEGKMYSVYPLYEFPELFQIICDTYVPFRSFQLIEADLLHEIYLPLNSTVMVKSLTYVYELELMDGEKTYLLLVGCLDLTEKTFLVVVASIYYEKISIKQNSIGIDS